MWTTAPSCSCSRDHGFASFRRGVNLNTWLHRNGYLALKDGACGERPLFRRRRLDPHQSLRARPQRALSQRERHGNRRASSNAPQPARWRRKSRASSPNLRDEEHDATAIRQAYATSSLYQGPYLDAAPDLIIGYNDGYRTSWDAATGKVGEHVIEDNHKAVERRSFRRPAAGPRRAFFQSRH